MKSNYIIVALLMLFISCGNDDDCIQETQQIAPTVIAEYHIMSSSGLINRKYIYNKDGVLIKCAWDGGQIIYSYDDQYKLINFSETDFSGNIIESVNISYDSNNRVSQIGDKIFLYDDLNSVYIANYEATTYVLQDGAFLLEEVFFSKYFYSGTDNPIIHRVGVEKIIETDVPTGNIMEWEYENPDTSLYYIHDGVNLLAYGGDYFSSYIYDDFLNPLYDEKTNLKYIFGFLNGGFNYLNFTLSKNNVVHFLWDTNGIEEIKYQYEFNSNGLPTKVFSSQYYGGIQETDWSHYSNYYYQGDEIPE